LRADQYVTLRFHWIGLALCVAACKSESAKEQERLEQSASWLATAHTLGQAWAENRVPTKYAERTLSEAHTQLVSAKQDSAAALVAHVSDVVRRRDRRAVEATIAPLLPLREELEHRASMMKNAR
jgi:hypothetical protein